MKAVYRIYCAKTFDSYIGSTNNVDRRREEHFKLLATGNHYNYKLQRDFNRYGTTAFRFEVLEECSFETSRSQLYDKEQSWLDKYKPYYNIQTKSREERPALIGLVVSETLKQFVVKVIREFTDIPGCIILCEGDADWVRIRHGVIFRIHDTNYIEEGLVECEYDYILDYTNYPSLEHKVENMLAKYSII